MKHGLSRILPLSFRKCLQPCPWRTYWGSKGLKPVRQAGNSEKSLVVREASGQMRKGTAVSAKGNIFKAQDQNKKLRSERLVKKLILILFSLILIASALSGCAGKPAAEQGGGEAVEAQATEDTQKAVENAMEVMDTSTKKEWPADKLPPDVIPPENCTFIGGLDVIENIPGEAWYFNYTCDGMNEAAAKAYFDKLRESGWSGDSQLVKDIEWNGKKYRADIEIYEIVGNTIPFIFF